MTTPKIFCIAGKNKIAVTILRKARRLLPPENLFVLPNSDDKGINDWQPSLLATARKTNTPIIRLEDLYGIQDLVLLSLESNILFKVEKFKSQNLFNLHFSLLPAYKGCHTSVWPILRGEKVTGVSLHKIDFGIDTGPIIAQKKVRIKPEYTAQDLYLRLMDAGVDLVSQYLETLIFSPETLQLHPQSSDNSSYYPRSSIDYKSITIPWKSTAYQIINFLRAFTFPKYQFIKERGKIIESWKIEEQRSTLPPGSIIEEDEISACFATIDYNIRLFWKKQDT
ncbi:Bifunctional polymyxin resistance protein ArnA [Tepidimonas alkaliphilus]|uniref:Bifunctional polymyxin resistance protein ArnA n=1 Tax=Tepidimonas alkaliphilus TaxID=2588942 RepID=A0A554W4Z2_9BURK|nr:formyltransferase family protein [Tepidimonas alkaliphilus]TSE18647.1 Bifunctional polymyxin resistance protein ArnA [Tepidimonas alkaliphilus]